MPEQLDLGDGIVLRRATTAHAAGIARAVGESLEHLRPFLPWADERNTREAVQRARLITVDRLWRDGREHQYAIEGDEQVVGMIGAMRADRWGVGGGTVEIGYWVHVDWCRRGIATRATSAVADAAAALPGVAQVVVVVDSANGPSNAVARGLGGVLAKVVEKGPEAPGESGRFQVWVLPGPASPGRRSTEAP